MSLTDEDILMQAAVGGSPAVGACIDRFGPLVLALARRTLIDQALVEDAVQDVFIEIWKSAGRFDASRGSAKSFVATIAKRRLIDRGRMEQVRVRGVAPIDAADRAGDDPGGAGPLATAEEAARAAELIERMSEPQRSAVKLSLGQGWSHQRIADHLSVPLGTVKTMLRRAVMGLREALSPVSMGGAQ